MNKKAILFLVHIPVWLVVFAFVLSNRYKSLLHEDQSLLIVISMLIVSFWLLLSFYTFYSYLVPRYLEKNKYIKFAVFAALFVLVIIPLLQLSLGAVLHTAYDIKESFFTTNKIYSWIGIAASTLFCGTLGTFYRFGIDWFKNLQLKKELENENLQSELKMLKSKLNPHLLFNTLNNIDALIQNSPEKASVALSKLSDILRYVVYDTESEKVPIQKEIENLEKYIDLEKIRLHHPDSIEFKNLITQDILIPPMLFFPFVENAFKHSNLNNAEQRLSIFISTENDRILFKCINSIYDKKQSDEHAGMGLELAKKRLELLYPDTHKLTIGEIDHKFHVNIEINT